MWAPRHEHVSVKLTSQRDRLVDLAGDDYGYFVGEANDVSPGDRYLLQLSREHCWPDPASHYQPDGVHQPSAVVDHGSFPWTDESWKGVPLAEMVQYELHVGTFTPEGTFAGVEERLPYLKDLGINTIELLPVSQFPGARNWGYDGAYPYAVQNSYGGPDGLKSLVDACHARGIAVVLDVVYNHLGPEGNYLGQFAPYFTDKYSTPWGDAVNFDDALSDGVRNYVVQNALHWFENYHFDALRLDAIHGIFDFSAKHILQELAEETADYSTQRGRPFLLIAESDLNDVRVIRSREAGGFGIDGQWSDDFHHAVHTILTGEHTGYYEDFGQRAHIVKALTEGFVYAWDYSTYRRRRHGSSSAEIPADRFVVFSQNHDQVGNRMLGDRLVNVTSFDAARLAAGLTILSPNIPMLFMGEEFAEKNPFLYFVSHGDEHLINAVREGRKSEFRAFGWKGEPPDPQSEDTFNSSKITWDLLKIEAHAAMHMFYRALISLRKTTPALSLLSKDDLGVQLIEDDDILVMTRHHPGGAAVCIFNLTNEGMQFRPQSAAPGDRLLFNSQDARWGGTENTVPDKLEAGSMMSLDPYAFVVYHRK